jgi:hypothetical protein
MGAFRLMVVSAAGHVNTAYGVLFFDSAALLIGVRVPPRPLTITAVFKRFARRFW